MGKIIGIGGIFIKSMDIKRLADWYLDVFEIEIGQWGTTFPISQIKNEESQVFSLFPADTKYINETQSYMINWMVDDLDALVEKLKTKNVEILGSEGGEFGKFAWVNDIDGNKLELWEQPKITNK
jgi:predicted enzyme related to lactoylglutathione lyase